MNIQYYFAVDNIAATHAQIEVAVMRGQRPDLSAITGPEAAVKHVKDCVSRCWDQSPDSRPSFAGRPIFITFAFLRLCNDLRHLQLVVRRCAVLSYE